MKATLTFDLDQPEDAIAHLRCVRATDMAIVLHSIVHTIRRDMIRSYEISDKPAPTIEDVFDKIYAVLEEYDLNIDTLII
jgi:hypothetical protein